MVKKKSRSLMKHSDTELPPRVRLFLAVIGTGDEMAKGAAGIVGDLFEVAFPTRIVRERRSVINASGSWKPFASCPISMAVRRQCHLWKAAG